MANHAPGLFGAVLKRYRVAALLTQEQLAARAHLSSDTIRALESGKRRTPHPESVRLLLDALALTAPEREELLAAAALPASRRRANDWIAPPLPARVALGAAQPSRLVGREGELATIRQRLTSEGATAGERVRLLTLTGPAGVGKTRLAFAAATQIASHFPDGVVLVDLSPVRDPVLVLPTIAHAFGLGDISSKPLETRLHDILRERSLLLILDNFEQVLPAASALADLLTHCPDLVLLVTSRVPLRLRWEWALRVPPLPVPDLNAPLPPLDTLKAIPAIDLFTARARAQRADFALTAVHAPLVARLASELDGLPLALELAAARLDTLSLPALARRIGDRLRLLRWEAPDLPERQQSLEAAIGWSYDLLSEPEQHLFRCLGVFAGYVALPALTAVSAALLAGTANPTGAATDTSAASEGRTLAGLTSLAEKSLVLPTWVVSRDRHEDNEAHNNEAPSGEDAEPAFTMLETVREYASEQLERQGTLETAQCAHAYYFLDLAEQADSHLRGPDQLAWYARLERDHDNLRAALRWLLSRDGADAAAEREAGLRLAAALGWFWWTRGYIVEGARWLIEALDHAPDADAEIRLRSLLVAGVMLAYQGAFGRAHSVLKDALALAQQRQNPVALARAYTYLGLCAIYSQDVAAGVPLLREALRRGRELGDPHPLGMTLMFLGATAVADDDDEQAISLYTESLARFETAGDQLFAANLRLNLGWFAWRQGDLRTAIEHIRAGLEVSVTTENRRLLSFGAQTALLLRSDGAAKETGESGTRAALTQQARLLGAIDILNQATGMTLMQTVLKASMVELRERIQRAGLEAVYREGRFLPFQAIASLALTLLDEIDQAAGRRPR